MSIKAKKTRKAIKSPVNGLESANPFTDYLNTHVPKFEAAVIREIKSPRWRKTISKLSWVL